MDRGKRSLSYGIVRVQKMTKGAIQGISNHDTRAKESKTNPDIDSTKSKENYNLSENTLTYHQKIKERISQLPLTRAVRKDAIVMAQVLITSDKSFFDSLSREKQKEFFKDSYNFLAEWYGKENIVSAVVHMDEKTPHMHFNFIPVTPDSRLSAKELLTPKTLGKQHDDFYREIGNKYGLDRGEKGGNKSHLETKEYKELMSKYENIQNKYADELENSCKLEKHIATLKQDKNALESKIEGLEREFKGKVLTKKGIDVIQPEKTVTGNLKNISLENIENLKKTAMKYPKAQEQIKKQKIKIEKLEKELELTKAKIPTIKERLSAANKVIELEEKERAFKRLPEEKQKELLNSNQNILNDLDLNR